MRLQGLVRFDGLIQIYHKIVILYMCIMKSIKGTSHLRLLSGSRQTRDYIKSTAW